MARKPRTFGFFGPDDGWEPLVDDYLTGLYFADGGSVEVANVCPKCNWANYGLADVDIPAPIIAERSEDTDNWGDTFEYECGRDGCDHEFDIVAVAGIGGVMLQSDRTPDSNIFYRNLRPTPPVEEEM